MPKRHELTERDIATSRRLGREGRPWLMVAGVVHVRVKRAQDAWQSIATEDDIAARTNSGGGKRGGDFSATRAPPERHMRTPATDIFAGVQFQDVRFNPPAGPMRRRHLNDERP